MNDLFGYVSRDERQAQCLRNWKAYNGHACVVAATGFGFLKFYNYIFIVKNF